MPPTVSVALLMHLVLQLELPADARLLPMTRRTVGEYLFDAGTADQEREDVVLALDEACANVIRHAFPDDGEGRIRLLAEITDGEVRVQVEDDGVGFDVLAPRPLPDPWATSGRGLRIIREVMTSVELHSPTESGGTRVVMQRARSVPVPAAIAAAAGMGRGRR